MSGQAQVADGDNQDTAGASAAAATDGAKRDIEIKARQMGWRPREEFRGPDKNWIDAEEFVERGESWVPYLQERNRFFERTVQTQQREIDDLKGMIAEGNERLRRSEAIGYKRALRELETRKAEAISNADPNEVRRVEQEIRELGPEPAQQQTTQQNRRPDPVVTDWVEDNPWVKASGRAFRMATEELNEVQRESPMMPLADQLAEVKRRIMPLFVRNMERQDNGGDDGAGQRRNNPPPVNRSGSVNGRARTVAPRSFEAMPEAVRAQYEKEKRVLDGKGQALTKEEYASYYWEQFPDDGL